MDNIEIFFNKTCKIDPEKIYELLGNDDYLKQLALCTHQTNPIVEYIKNQEISKQKDFITGLSWLLPFSGTLIGSIFERDNFKEFKELFIISLNNLLNTFDKYSGRQTYKTKKLDEIISEILIRRKELKTEDDAILEKARELEIIKSNIQKLKTENEILESQIQLQNKENLVLEKQIQDRNLQVKNLEKSIPKLSGELKTVQVKLDELNKQDQILAEKLNPIKQKVETLLKTNLSLDENITNWNQEKVKLEEQIKIKQNEISKLAVSIADLKKDSESILNEYEEKQDNFKRIETETKDWIPRIPEIKDKLEQISQLFNELKNYINPDDEAKKILGNKNGI